MPELTYEMKIRRCSSVCGSDNKLTMCPFLNRDYHAIAKCWFSLVMGSSTTVTRLTRIVRCAMWHGETSHKRIPKRGFVEAQHGYIPITFEERGH